MHPVAREYVAARKDDMPPDPSPGDLAIHRVPGQCVYSVLPFTFRGLAFVCDHADAGSVHGDLLMVPLRSIFSFMNEVFDEGMKVV